MLSRRIGKCLIILLVVYLTVTVYIASTLLVSPATNVEGVGDGSSQDMGGISKTKTNLADKKYQLFKIRNPKFSSNDYGNVKQQEIRTTLKHIGTSKTEVGHSSTNSSDIRFNLEGWKQKIIMLRNKQDEKARNSSKLLRLEKLKEMVAQLKGKTLGNNTMLDLRGISNDLHAILSRYHVNMAALPGETLVYSAYLDKRKPTRFVRIVLISKRLNTNKDIICKFLLPDNSNITLVSPLILYETCEGHMKLSSSFIGSCAVPSNDVLLDQIILSSGSTDIFMNVIDNNKKTKTDQQNLAICVPPLFGNVDILRLTEFIELSRILGAQHFVFYPKFVSSELLSLLDYYQGLGLVTVMLWNMTIPENQIWYHGQSASIWDCLYRTMFKFRHVAFMDFDEFIVPRFQNTIPDFLSYLQEEQNINNENISAYKFKSVFFDSKFNSVDDVPELPELRQLVTLNNTVRTRKFSRVRTKLVVNPANVFELGIHHVSKPNEEHYKCYEVHPKQAFIHHYRQCKPDYGMNCKLTEKDTSIMRYRSQLVHSVRQQLLDASTHKPTV